VAAIVEAAPVGVASVHTPHVRPDETAVFVEADDLARRLDAYLVVHSQYAHHSHVPQFERLGFESAYGYENNPGASPYYLRNAILDRGHDLVLDTAHLYMATDAPLDALESLLDDYRNRIRVVHLNDATPLEDGLAFGAGEMDLKRTTGLLAERFDGTVVLEVMPDDQRAALERTDEWLGVNA
ncbi:MAG: sugar phosphate isomerase/epimerase family protein, partial [Halobacterium sp.]